MRAGFAVASMPAIVFALATGAASPAQSVPVYDILSDAQKRVLVGVTPRAGSQQESRARAIFEGASVSVRAAFIAVTTPLAAVSLSDHENGEILGVALDLVDRVELLEGQPAGAGDEGTARLRVTLASGARDRLRRSSEFERAPTVSGHVDTIVYRHEGPPSVEITITSLAATIVVR